MGKSIAGPDWTDIEGMMRAIEAAHGGLISVVFTPRGIGATGGMSLIVHSSFASAEPGLVEGLATESFWPCAEGCALETHVFGGLWQHDVELGKRLRGGKTEG